MATRMTPEKLAVLEAKLKEEAERVALQRCAAFHGFDTRAIISTDLEVLRKNTEAAPEFNFPRVGEFRRSTNDPNDPEYQRVCNRHINDAVKRYDEILRIWHPRLPADWISAKTAMREAGCHRVPNLRTAAKRVRLAKHELGLPVELKPGDLPKPELKQNIVPNRVPSHPVGRYDSEEKLFAYLDGYLERAKTGDKQLAIRDFVYAIIDAVETDPIRIELIRRANEIWSA